LYTCSPLMAPVLATVPTSVVAEQTLGSSGMAVPLQAKVMGFGFTDGANCLVMAAYRAGARRPPHAVRTTYLLHWGMKLPRAWPDYHADLRVN
jgi:hypothetical protein